MNRRKILTITAMSFFAVILIVSTGINVTVVATGTISPSTAEGLVNMPSTFYASGLDTEETYLVKLGAVIVLTALEPTSSGTLQFDVTPTTAGNYVVSFCYANETVIATASLKAIDIIETIIPPLILLVSISIVLGVVAELKFTGK